MTAAAGRDLQGRTYLVTGANSGIGRAAAHALAARGARIHLACRSPHRARQVAAEITARTPDADVATLPLDLADLASVRACAEAFLALDEPLHGLVNNAGIVGQRGLTRDGFELAFGVNHLGHFLLTLLLRERLVESAPARVVVLTSKFLEHAAEIPLDRLRPSRSRYSGLRAYGVSKLATALFTEELAARWAGTGVTSYAVHPGLVGSHIWQGAAMPLRPLLRLLLKSPEEGAVTPLYCLTAADVAADSGGYYEDCRRLPLPGPARPSDLPTRLWDASEKWVAAFLPAAAGPQPADAGGTGTSAVL